MCAMCARARCVVGALHTLGDHVGMRTTAVLVVVVVVGDTRLRPGAGGGVRCTQSNATEKMTEDKARLQRFFATQRSATRELYFPQGLSLEASLIASVTATSKSDVKNVPCRFAMSSR